MSISYALLKKQDASTSSTVQTLFQGNAKFVEFAKSQTAGIIARDAQDDEALAKGIQIAIDKKVIPADVDVEKVTKVDAFNKTPEAVADEIIGCLGDAVKGGYIMTLQGLSGTGKGTTVAVLKEKLGAMTWSNGNLFRSVTLLAVTWCEQNNKELGDALTPEMLEKFMGMISFGKFNGSFDVKIDGLGIQAYVSEIQNTDLKQSKVGKNIPIVAEVTQGEVINFVKGALDLMVEDGVSVLLEGRAQTLNYIRTPHRFELVLSDEQLIGRRRAAQRMMAGALEAVKEGAPPDEIAKSLESNLDSMMQEE